MTFLDSQKLQIQTTTLSGYSLCFSRISLNALGLELISSQSNTDPLSLIRLRVLLW